MSESNYNKIVIRDLELDASIGIYDFEKSNRQMIIINLEAWFSKNEVFKDTNIEDTINYEFIVTIVKSCCQDKHNDLIENLAEEISEKLLNHEKIYAVKLRIEKPDVLKAEKNGSIGVEIYRS